MLLKMYTICASLYSNFNNYITNWYFVLNDMCFWNYFKIDKYITKIHSKFTINFFFWKLKIFWTKTPYKYLAVFKIRVSDSTNFLGSIAWWMIIVCLDFTVIFNQEARKRAINIIKLFLIIAGFFGIWKYCSVTELINLCVIVTIFIIGMSPYMTLAHARL